jgi:DNA (cytosine-5)-methyltransferase 1
MTRPIAVDLFAGAGGMSLGFEQAGFDLVAAIEIDPIHAAVHKFNFPKCATLCRDIAKVSAADIRSAAKIEDRTVDVVVGGAPCQGFSLIGQRSLDDPRNQLVNEYVRIVCDLDANYFVFENVKGLTLGRQRAFLDELVAAFERRGYAISNPWRVLNAADYGVPQNRERLVLIGAKNGLILPRYPQESSERVTCENALEDLPNVDNISELLKTDEVRISAKPALALSTYAREMRCDSNRAWHSGYRRKWDRNFLTASIFKYSESGNRCSPRRFHLTAPHPLS